MKFFYKVSLLKILVTVEIEFCFINLVLNFIEYSYGVRINKTKIEYEFVKRTLAVIRVDMFIVDISHKFGYFNFCLLILKEQICGYPHQYIVLKLNNFSEADILTGWSKNTSWRADVRYAAMVVKVIIDHYNEFVNKRNIKIEVLSNDNAFLNYHPYYFTQRTLLARYILYF